jgi:hypothetical protein
MINGISPLADGKLRGLSSPAEPGRLLCAFLSRTFLADVHGVMDIADLAILPASWRMGYWQFYTGPIFAKYSI